MGDSEHSEHLLVSVINNIGCIRVQERGTFKISGALKQFGTSCMAQDVEKIIFDMTECVGMDSTFMGVIAGMAFRLKQKGQGKIIMIGLSTRTRSLLSTLGLDQLVESHMKGMAPADLAALFAEDDQALEEVNEPVGSRKETTELMLEAHSSLVELSAENQPKFKDVLAFLKEDLERAEKDDSE
jgi:anti-anti-sigma regulatory factor